MRQLFYRFENCDLASSICRFVLFVANCVIVECTDQLNFAVNLKRFFVIIVICPFWFALLLWNHFGFVLDDFLYRKWHLEVIHRPMFIVGNARSGTTWFHRIITTNTFTNPTENIFVTFKTWEILFAVSVSWKVLFQYLFLIDHSLLGGTIYCAISLLEKFFLSDIKVHPIGLFLPEEDDWLMVHIGLSQLIMFFFPMGGNILNDLVFFEQDERVSEALRRTIFSYYRDAVKRQLYFISHCREGTSLKRRIVFVSKNPAFTMRTNTLFEFFPDCRIVCLWRDPAQSVSSMVSYISTVTRDSSIESLAHSGR